MTDLADLALGSFSADGPWEIDPTTMTWRYGIDGVRAATKAEERRLTKRRRLPPGLRVIRTGLVLGGAIGGWALTDRRRYAGTPQSRAGLARRLRVAFQRLGPTYIKLGQIISSGEGIFPEELVGEFRLLRDRVPPESWETVQKILEEDLGTPISEVFAHIERTPMAAASIAQVHAATLLDGTEVAVKVQRPTVQQRVHQDLAAMVWIAPLLVGRIPVTALANPPALVELFAETIVEELDFRLEAQNMLDVAAVLASTNHRAVIVPRPHPELVTRRVLVMEKIQGFSFEDVAGMKAAGVDTNAVVRACMVLLMEGCMLHGVFHGDMHGGNLLVRADGSVALLDFGITGRLDEQKRLAFLRLMIGSTSGDTKAQLGGLVDLGALPSDTDLDQLIVDLGIEGPIKDPTKMSPDEITAELQDIVKKLLGYGARMPKELMLFVKDMLFIDAALTTLAPDVDLFAEMGWIAGHFATQHGERIAADIGIDITDMTPDLDAMRAGFGIAEEVDSLSHADLRARRQQVREQFEANRRKGRRAKRS
ncbi:MAG TPA: AarF/UbiB family protein [Acidimicrobiales bacterium]|nr:AarF/UbiB family protein [Acidimicrobiales bacterium]